jgi:hypothetical protein
LCANAGWFATKELEPNSTTTAAMAIAVRGMLVFAFIIACYNNIPYINYTLQNSLKKIFTFGKSLRRFTILLDFVVKQFFGS